MAKKKIKRLIFFLIIIIIAFVASQTSREDVKMKKSGIKVLLIGIDGMDPEITNKLIDEGKLPNFQKLKEKAYYSELSTCYPPHSPVAWASIATGRNPGKHNIFDFIRRDPGTYLPELSLAKSKSGIGGTDYISYVKSDSFWKIASKAGIPTTVIRWPLTFPPERVEGSLLSGLGVPDIGGFLSGYTFYNEKKNGEKSIKVARENGIIKTIIRGPKVKKGSDITDITAQMEIKISDNITLTVDGVGYPVDGWSDWIMVKFKINLLKRVYGIFKAYVVSKEPFEMYITAIQFDPKNPIVDISYPKQYSSDLAEEIGLYYTLGMPEETEGYVDGKISKRIFLEHVKEIEAERDRMFWKEFDNFEEGIYAFVYDSSDRIQHVTWDSSKISDPIEEYYIEKDKFLGDVLSKIKGKNTALFVFSDHGFTSFDRAVSINRWLVENGFMALTKDEGEAPLFKNVDWSKTKAYSLGFNSIYINLKGRESKGIVEDKDKVAGEIIAKLEQLKDSDKKVINKVYRTEDIHSGEYVKDGPDMIIGFNPGYRMAWQTAVGGLTDDVIFDNEKVWKGDHLVDPKFVPGVLFSNVKLKKGNASQMDIVPTVMDIFDIEIPEDMDGESLLK